MRIPSWITLMWWASVQSTLFAQGDRSSLVGRYADGYGRPELAITNLILDPDSGFELTTVDPVFSNTHQRFTSSGRWGMAGDRVVLNPHLPPLTNSVQLRVLDEPSTDSLTIRISYTLRQVGIDGSLVQEGPFDFDMISLYFNKPSDEIHLVRQTKGSSCLFSPKVKDQVLVGTDNSVRMAPRELERLGFLTYGLDDIVWSDVPAGAKALELVFVQVVDSARTPRQREVMIKGDKAYFYMRKGEIDKALTTLARY